MKFRYFNFVLIASFVFLTKCNVDKSPFMKGNWRTCTKDGTYLETYIHDSLTFQLNKQGIHQTHAFKIVRDTLKYYSIGEDSPLIESILLVAIDNDSMMTWTSIVSGESWVLKRLVEEINIPSIPNFGIESLRAYEKEKEVLKRRAAKYRCVDRRTPTEIYQDSVNSSFQF